MKVLLTSPDALFDFTSRRFFPGIVDVLDRLESESIIAGTIVVSSDSTKLSHIPDRLNPLMVAPKIKQGKDLVRILVEELPELTKYNDLIVLGGNNGDLYMSANSKLLLFSAQFALKNNPADKIFNYGINIDDPNDLYSFLKRFYNVGEYCFYELEINNTTRMFSIVNSNFKHEGDANLKKIRQELRNFLKHHTTNYGELFTHYFLMSLYNKIDALRTINYWGVYPSSTEGQYNPDVVKLKEQARKIFKCSNANEVFVRFKNSEKRAYMSPSDRLSNACDNQLDSIIINPAYKGKLEGKVVCIIDDFTTYGSSCETARILLDSAGVAEVVFITIGKYGSGYYKQFYQVSGNVFTPGYSYSRQRTAIPLYGTFHRQSNPEVKAIFKGLI